MKKIFLLGLFLLTSCATVPVPREFAYKPMQTNQYLLASWQKITDSSSPIRIYLEGDGKAFDYRGLPTQNPTPKNKFLRNMAFSDPHANVVYLARPCQFVQDPHCKVEDWTVGRFSEQIVEDTALAIKQISQDREIVLIGYSGGALLSGLLITRHPELKIQKWITIAGLLNHTDWTQYWGDTPLYLSLDLQTLPTVEQQHFAGARDKVIPLELSKKWVGKNNLAILPHATHNKGFTCNF